MQLQRITTKQMRIHQTSGMALDLKKYVNNQSLLAVKGSFNRPSEELRLRRLKLRKSSRLTTPNVREER